MGMFEDAELRLREKESAEIKKQAELEAEQTGTAVSVMEELGSFLASAARTDIEPVRDGNRISISAVGSKHVLYITCKGADAFVVQGYGGELGQISRDAMSEKVLAWLRA